MTVCNVSVNCTLVIINAIEIVAVDEECGSHIGSLQFVQDPRSIDPWAIIKCERNLIGSNTTVQDCSINLGSFNMIMKWWSKSERWKEGSNNECSSSEHFAGKVQSRWTWDFNLLWKDISFPYDIDTRSIELNDGGKEAQSECSRGVVCHKLGCRNRNEPRIVVLEILKWLTACRALCTSNSQSLPMTLFALWSDHTPRKLTCMYFLAPRLQACN